MPAPDASTAMKSKIPGSRAVIEPCWRAARKGGGCKELTKEVTMSKNRRLFPVLHVTVSGLDPTATCSFLRSFGVVGKPR